MHQKGRWRDCLLTTNRSTLVPLLRFRASYDMWPSVSPGCIDLPWFLTTGFSNLQLGLSELFQTSEFFQIPITGWL